MPWVRFDDQFPIHRKVKGLSDASYRLHTEAIFWCARNLTDGYIARDELRDVSGIAKPDRHLPELVRRGLWVETDDGWVIHSYLEFQPSKAQVLAERKAAAARQKRWREGKSAGQAGRRVSNGVSHGVSNASPSRPVKAGDGEGASPVDNSCTHGEERGPRFCYFCRSESRTESA